MVHCCACDGPMQFKKVQHFDDNGKLVYEFWETLCPNCLEKINYQQNMGNEELEQQIIEGLVNRGG